MRSEHGLLLLEGLGVARCLSTFSEIAWSNIFAGDRPFIRRKPYQKVPHALSSLGILGGQHRWAASGLSRAI